MQDLEGDGNDVWVTSVQSGLDRDDELRNNWKDFGSALFKHVESSLDGEESVWFLLLANSFKENWKVVMVVKRHDVNLPQKLILMRTMVDGDWEVTSVVETAEFRWWHETFVCGSGFWLLCCCDWFWVQLR